jgi:hypothetical protein
MTLMQLRVIATDEREYTTDKGVYRAHKRERLQIGGGYKWRWELWSPTEKRWPLGQNLTLTQVRLKIKEDLDGGG